MTTSFRTAAIALALTAAPACTGGPEPIVEETSGELGLGTFRWNCLTSADPTCGTGVFPALVARDGYFGLEFFPSDDLPSEIVFDSIQPVSPSRVTAATAFQGTGEGTISFVAWSRRSVIDFVTVSIVSVDRLTLSLQQESPPGESSCGFLYCVDIPGPPPDEGGDVALFAGGVADVQAMPYSIGTRLAGALSYEWESLSPDLLVVEPGRDRDARLTALSEGLARLAIRAGGHEEIVEVFIADLPPPRRTMSDEDSTSGSDSDSGSDSGSGSDTDSDTDESGSGSGTGTGTDSESGGESGDETTGGQR